MARHAYKSTPLFGGAIVVDMPEKFVDVRYVNPSQSCHKHISYSLKVYN
jgi:hypothetical protein